MNDKPKWKPKGFYKPKSLIFQIIGLFLICNILAIFFWFLLSPLVSVAGINLTLFQSLKWLNILSAIGSIYLALKNLINNNFNSQNKEKIASARWMTKEEFNKKFKRQYFDKGKHKHGWVTNTSIYQAKKKFSFQMSEEIGHLLGIGGTRTGKTSLILDPEIRILASAKTKSSMCLSDPKGELFNKHSKWLAKQGYEVLVLNIRDSNKSHYWNPLDKVWMLWKSGKIDTSIAYLNELVDSLCAKDENTKQDSFFAPNAKDLLKFFIVAYLEISDMEAKNKKKFFTREKFNLSAMRDNVHLNTLEKLKELKEILPEYSRAMFFGGKHIDSDAQKTTNNILQTIVADLTVYGDPIVKNVTKKTSIKIDPSKPQVIFIIVPDETKAKYPFVSLFVGELYKELIALAYLEKKQRLPRPFYFLLDEFGNIPKIANMESALTVGASRNIFFGLFIQDYTQLYRIYGKNNATTIMANCAYEYFVLTNEIDTATKFSNKLGNKTFKMVSQSSSGKGLSSSFSDRAKKLIEPSQLLNLEFGNIIIKIQREMPINKHFVPFFDWIGFEQGALELKTNQQEGDFHKNHFVDMYKAVELFGNRDSENQNNWEDNTTPDENEEADYGQPHPQYVVEENPYNQMPYNHSRSKPKEKHIPFFKKRKIPKGGELWKK